MNLISVTIPVYRNGGSLIELHKRIIESIALLGDTYDYEIIFTDDGSDDNSFKILQNLNKNDRKVKVVKLSRNFGQHAANQAAFSIAKGDYIVNMSADLQDPPELIYNLIQALEQGNDIALAARQKVNESIFKKLTSSIHYKLVRISVPNYPTRGFDFWAVNQKAFKAFRSFDDIIRRNQIDLLSIGYKIATVPYEKMKRTHGKSQYNFSKRLNISLSQILASAYWPLRLASSFGIIFTISGFIYGLWLLVNYFFRESPFEGWTPIMLLLLIIGGLNMLILGIIGEYLWRIYFEIKKRPIYFIDQVLNNTDYDDEKK